MVDPVYQYIVIRIYIGTYSYLQIGTMLGQTFYVSHFIATERQGRSLGSFPIFFNVYVEHLPCYQAQNPADGLVKIAARSLAVCCLLLFNSSLSHIL